MGTHRRIGALGALVSALVFVTLVAATAMAASLSFFEPRSSPEAVGDIPRSAAAADLDGDGDQDLAVANSGSNTVSILFNNGTGNFRQASSSPEPAGDVPYFVVAADLDGDGDQDLAIANPNVGQVTILKNNGTGNFRESSFSPAPAGAGAQSIAAADLDGDGDMDLAVANSVNNNVTILRNNGAGKFTQPGSSPEPAGSAPTSIVAADLDGDGDQDLAVANFNSSDVTILLNNGKGNFSRAASSPEPAGANPMSIVAAKLDGNGSQDLAVANFNSDDVTVLDNNGSGDFSEPASSPEPAGDGPWSLTAADFEGDGDQDLAVANTNSGDVTILGNNGSGGFHEPPSSPHLVGSQPQSIVNAELNAAFGQDLAVVNAGSSNVTILDNR